jgi:ATP-dependent protease ClpP protease subunit
MAAIPPVHYVSFLAEINPTTSETLLGIFGELIKNGASTVYLLISTPGGNVMCGMNLYNTLRALPIHLITHNVGNVDSIGNVVFLAGEQRFSCPHATFMFHGVGFDITDKVRLEEKMLRERLGSILADHERLAAILAERSNITTNEAEKLFQEAQTRDPNYALSKGLIHEIKDAQVPSGAPFFQLVFKR